MYLAEGYLNFHEFESSYNPVGQSHTISRTWFNDSNKYVFKNSRRNEPLNRSINPFCCCLLG